MNIIIGSARIDENGKLLNGKLGDQKQKSTPDYFGEVSLQKFYEHKKGWYVLRPKDPEHAKAIANKMSVACSNPYIGYDQSNRYGVVKYGVNTTKDTECDCSSLVRACVKEATGKDPGDFNTANEITVLGKTGLFESKKEYKKGMPLYEGDILVTQVKGHTAIVVEGARRMENASSDTLNGIDVSHWQKGIDLTTIQADFVICKASQGTTKKDECLDIFAKQVLDSGKLLGLYHFADGKSSGVLEATWFLKCVEPYIGKAILVLDWEADALKRDVSYAWSFLETVKAKTNSNPIIYFSTNVAREKDWTDMSKQFPHLWGAKYGKNPVRTSYITERIYDGEDVRGFTEIMRQYSSKTHLKGYDKDLDANVFYGTKKDWIWLCNGTVLEDKPVEVEVEYYPQYTGTSDSIVTALLAVGEKDTSYTHRGKIAVANKIKNYEGSAGQNTKMLNKLKKGKLIKA